MNVAQCYGDSKLYMDGMWWDDKAYSWVNENWDFLAENYVILEYFYRTQVSLVRSLCPDVRPSVTNY